MVEAAFKVLGQFQQALQQGGLGSADIRLDEGQSQGHAASVRTFDLRTQENVQVRPGTVFRQLADGLGQKLGPGSGAAQGHGAPVFQAVAQA